MIIDNLKDYWKSQWSFFAERRNMKKILKQTGMFVLVFSLMLQSFHVNADAAETVSGNQIETEISRDQIKDSGEISEIIENDIDLSDWRQMVLWFEKECNNDFLELAAKDQAWWDSLLPNQRKTAEMYAKFITAKDSDPNHYTFETLEEAIEKMEGGLAIEEFFDGSRFASLESEDLYDLRDNGFTLEDAALFMEAQYQPEVYQSDLYEKYKNYQNGKLSLEEEEVCRLERLNEIALKMMPMDYYGASAFWEPSIGDRYASMGVSSTGYGAGSNTTFGTHGTIYKLMVGGKSGFCLSYGSSARTGYMYGDILQTNDRIGWIVQNYAGSGSKAFVGAQIVIWCLQKGITGEGQVAALISTMVYGSTSQSDVSDIINEGRAALNGSAGKSGTYYTLRGPSGSQVAGLKDTPTWSTYIGGGSGGGTDPGEPDEPTPPPAPDPEYGTYSDNITVSYNVLVTKKDIDAGINLAGAVIEVYENGSRVATLTTGSNGTASWSTSRSHSASAQYCTNYEELDGDGKDEVASKGCYESENDARNNVESELNSFASNVYTYSAKEITAPYGYYNSEKNVTPVQSIRGNETANLIFSDKEQQGELTIKKEGEVLTGAAVTNDGVTFQYEVKPLSGAVYSLYAAETIKTGYGKNLYHKGDLVKSGLTTGTDGTVKLGNLHLGKYTVRETKPPHGYILNNAEKIVTFTYAGQDVLIVYQTTNYNNIRQKAEVSLLKQDSDTKNPLDGAVYGLYADSDIKDYLGNKIVEKGTLIEKVTTAENGKAVFQADIPIDLKYVVKEITAPYGYYKNESPYSFSCSYTNGNEAIIKFSNIFENDRVLGYVDLTKYDVESESDITQGNTESLEGAVYGIYAAEDIIHSDGATGVIHEKDALVATATIDKSGQTRFCDLELGKYYIKEMTPPHGYMLDDTIYEATISYHGQNIKLVERDETGADDENGLTMDDANTEHDIYTGDYVIKQGVQFVKTSDDNYGTNLELIEGAGFSIYLITDLSGVKSGTLKPLNNTWSEEDVLTFYDYDFTGEPKARLYKRSNETWTTGDTKWLKSLGGNLYEVKEMFTDENGYIATPELPFGSYVIVETTTPEDHVSAKPFVVHIAQDGGVLYTDVTKQIVDKKYSEDDDLRYGDRKGTKEMEGRVLQKQKVINNGVTETYLRVVKADEEFLAAPGTYVKPEEVVRGTVLKESAKYLVKCLSIEKSKNSLRSLNWKYDAEGYLTYYSPVLKEKFGTEENPFTTSFIKKGGKIVDSYITLPQKLPVGIYELIEIAAPDGYVLSGSEQKLNDISADRVNGYEILEDVKTGVTFTISNGSVFPNGQMGMNKYAQTDSEGNLVVTVLQKNREQKGIIEIYKHGEQLASTEFSEKTIHFKYEDAPVEGAKFNIVAAEDIYTQELDKAFLLEYGVNVEDYLIHREGDVVATIATDRNGWGYAAGLYIGKYKIVEITAGEGFVLNTLREEFEITKQNQTVSFDIQKADYKNERQKIELNVIKKDAENAELLEGAVYALYTAEDIYTNLEFDTINDKWIVRDIPEVIVTADTLITTGITGSDGRCRFDGDLPLGKYYVKEIEAPAGYFSATETVTVDASYEGNKGGQEVAVQVHDMVFKNYVTKTVITKLDLTNGKKLAGAVLEVCEVQEDFNVSPIQKSGNYVTTQIERWTSEESLHLIKGLHLEKVYLLREMKPADGYVTAEEILFKIVEKTDDTGKPMGIAAVHFYDGKQWIETGKNVLAMSDDVTKLEVSKKDITTGKELPGATLEIYDEKGTMIHTWVSTDKPYYIEKLPIGIYTLVEKLAPKGYSYAENIAFEILDTGEIQKVEMFDDIWKVDVEKSAAEQVLPGNILEYRIDVVKNCTEEPLEKFTLTDVLPAEVCLMELWTGTYNQEGTYTVEYLTNLCKEWQVWGEELTTKENHQLLPPEILKENEFITAFRVNFGTVAGKFCNIEAPTYQVLVPLNVTKELRNVITLSAIVDGKPVSDQDETITRLEIPKQEEPETGIFEEPIVPDEKVTIEKEERTELPEQIVDTGDRNSTAQWIILLAILGIGTIGLKKRCKKVEKS